MTLSDWSITPTTTTHDADYTPTDSRHTDTSLTFHMTFDVLKEVQSDKNLYHLTPWAIQIFYLVAHDLQRYMYDPISRIMQRLQ